MWRCVLLCSVVGAAQAQPAATPRYSDEEYYRMPELFQLEEYAGCLALGGVYCLGSFELTPPAPHHALYSIMQDYSAHHGHYNHTRLHRGMCLARSCARQRPPPPADHLQHHYAQWFESCVNETTMTSHALSARLYKLDYCRTLEPDPELSLNEKLFAGVVATLLVCSILSTALDYYKKDDQKEGGGWATAWSVRGCWRELTAEQPRAATDLRVLDGIRTVCIVSLLIIHQFWSALGTYIATTKFVDSLTEFYLYWIFSQAAMLVNVFFTMSAFLLANKLLEQKRKGETITWNTVRKVLVNRFVRLSPCLYLGVWASASWLVRLADGPQWHAGVAEEARFCHRTWWYYLLYANNFNWNCKCFPHAWYLAADMQLYVLSLLLCYYLIRRNKSAISILAAILFGNIFFVFCLAFILNLVPTAFYAVKPDDIRTIYEDNISFLALYPHSWTNMAGSVGGLLVAFIHHEARDAGLRLSEYKTFRWAALWAPLLCVVWAGSSPRLAAPTLETPARLPAALLAAVERPVFVLLLATALLGAINGVHSRLLHVMRWRGFALLARLSYGVYLIHLTFYKIYHNMSSSPKDFSLLNTTLEVCAVLVVSYVMAVPLALLVELPALRLYRAVERTPRPAADHRSPPPHKHSLPTDKPSFTNGKSKYS